MRVRSRALAVAIAAASLLAPTVVATSASAAPAAAPKVPELAWKNCGLGDDLLCATAKVPLDYDRPTGRTTTLALAKKPASKTAERIGSVFVNPGGPGGSGVEMVQFGFGDQLSKNLNGRFDVVGFDPRGVGASSPLHCFTSEEKLANHFVGLPIFPYQEAQERPFYLRYKNFGSRCVAAKQIIARHMSTADAARDLDLLRRAVGDAKLTYLGFSYGSHLGNTYANLFPGKVRALVIDGVLDPRLWMSGRQIDADKTATATTFDEFLRLCDVAGPRCLFSVPGGSKDRWEALADAVRAKPLNLAIGVPYTYDFLIADAAFATYIPEVWGGPDGVAAFFDLLAAVALGDRAAGAATLQRAARLRAGFLARLETVRVREADYWNGFDSFYGVQCNDAEFPSSFPTFQAVARSVDEASRWSAFWWWLNAGCANWPVSSDRYAGPWTAKTSAPVLVVGNYFDPATDYAGAQASDELLPNSRLLTYAGWGHTAYGRTACVTAAVNSYLVSGTLPAEGTVCAAPPNPFLQPTPPLQQRKALSTLGLTPVPALLTRQASS